MSKYSLVMVVIGYTYKLDLCVSRYLCHENFKYLICPSIFISKSQQWTQPKIDFRYYTIIFYLFDCKP